MTFLISNVKSHQDNHARKTNLSLLVQINTIFDVACHTRLDELRDEEHQAEEVKAHSTNVASLEMSGSIVTGFICKNLIGPSKLSRCPPISTFHAHCLKK